MALVKKNNARRTMITLIVFIALIAGAGVAYYFVQRTGPTDKDTDMTTFRDDPIPTEFNLAPLQAARDRGLKHYGQDPVSADPFGNQDPFSQRF